MPEGSEATFRDHLERLVECAVCMDTATDPRRLPCGHSFCRECLDGLLKSSQSVTRVKCPHCRTEHYIGHKGAQHLPKDFIIKQITDMIGTQGVPDKSGRCDFCSKTFAKTDIFYYCFDCDCICCTDCCPKHRCIKGRGAILKKMDFQYSMICERHPHPVRFICQTCGNRLCKKCERQGICDNHEIFDIFGGIMINDDTPTIPKYTTLKMSDVRGKKTPTKQPNEPEEDFILPHKSPGRMSLGEISVTSSTFYTETQDENSSSRSRPTSTIHEESVIEVIDTLEQDANPQPWTKQLDVKIRAVTMLPNGHVVVLTESSVLSFTTRGNEVSVKKGVKVKLEDAQHLVYWPYRDALVVTERMPKRLSLLKKDGTQCYRQIKVKPKRRGFFSCASSQSGDIKDFGPNHIAVTPEGGFALTTANTMEEDVKPTYDVIVYNNRCKVSHRWQCDLPPLSVACDDKGLLYFPQWHTVLVYKKDGTKMYQFGDKKTLFQPLRVQPYVDEHQILVAHRKSYIGDDYSVWRVSKWDCEGEEESKRKGHMVEFIEGNDGPIVDINLTKDVLIVAMEKCIQSTPLADLTLR